MRRLAMALLSCAACSAVVDGRIQRYEGACADEEEATLGRYDGRSVTEIAMTCHGCPSEDCVEDCILDATQGNLTFECTACFADGEVCRQTSCAAECGDGGDPQACADCFCASTCAHDFEECAGLATPSCPAT